MYQSVWFRSIKSLSQEIFLFSDNNTYWDFKAAPADSQFLPICKEKDLKVEISGKIEAVYTQGYMKYMAINIYTSSTSWHGLNEWM